MTKALALTLLAVCAANLHAQEPRTRRGPAVSILAGVAPAENDWGAGVMAGLNVRWRSERFPLELRFIPSVQRYHQEATSREPNSVLLFVNTPLALEYAFRKPDRGVTLYALGGGGLHVSHFEVSLPGESPVSARNIDLGFQFGVGARTNGRWSLEGRWSEVNGFSSFPILLGFRF